MPENAVHHPYCCLWSNTVGKHLGGTLLQFAETQASMQKLEVDVARWCEGDKVDVMPRGVVTCLQEQLASNWAEKEQDLAAMHECADADREVLYATATERSCLQSLLDPCRKTHQRVELNISCLLMCVRDHSNFVGAAREHLHFAMPRG